MWRAAKQGILIFVLSAIAVLSVSTNADAQGTPCLKLLPSETCN
jgi:hypothetical protein